MISTRKLNKKEDICDDEFSVLTQIFFTFSDKKISGNFSIKLPKNACIVFDDYLQNSKLSNKIIMLSDNDSFIESSKAFVYLDYFSSDDSESMLELFTAIFSEKENPSEFTKNFLNQKHYINLSIKYVSRLDSNEDCFYEFCDIICVTSNKSLISDINELILNEKFLEESSNVCNTYYLTIVDEKYNYHGKTYEQLTFDDLGELESEILHLNSETKSIVYDLAKREDFIEFLRTFINGKPKLYTKDVISYSFMGVDLKEDVENLHYAFIDDLLSRSFD